MDGLKVHSQPDVPRGTLQKPRILEFFCSFRYISNMGLSLVLMTIIAVMVLLIGLGFIFNLLLNPVKERLHHLKEDISKIKEAVLKP